MLMDKDLIINTKCMKSNWWKMRVVFFFFSNTSPPITSVLQHLHTRIQVVDNLGCHLHYSQPLLERDLVLESDLI